MTTTALEWGRSKRGSTRRKAHLFHPQVNTNWPQRATDCGIVLGSDSIELAPPYASKCKLCLKHEEAT